MLVSKRSRGAVIAVVAVALFGGFAVADTKVRSAADERAAEAEVRLRERLPALTVEDVLVGKDATAVIGPFREIRQAPGGALDVSVEVTSAWRARCVIAHREASGTVTTRTVDGHCT